MAHHKRGRPKAKRVETRLARGDEQRQFRRVKRYVRGFCGPVSDAEVLRYLVRNWTGS